MGDFALWMLGWLVVGAGVLGLFLPLLPGAPLVWVGLVIAAGVDGFERVGWGTLAGLGVLAGLAVGLDYLAASLGASWLKASRRAGLGAFLGTVVGLFFGLPGLLAGPFVGAAAGSTGRCGTCAGPGRWGWGPGWGWRWGRSSGWRSWWG
ncbi:MAG: DUF456 domain-containing protein [Thermoanaerobaculia bacterium]